MSEKPKSMTKKPWEYKPTFEEIEQGLSNVVNRVLSQEYGRAEQELDSVQCALDMAKEYAKKLNKNGRVRGDIRDIGKEIMSYYKCLERQKESFQELFSVKREAFGVKENFDNAAWEINKAAKEIADKVEHVNHCSVVIDTEIARSEVRIAEEILDKKIKSFAPISALIETHGRKLASRVFCGISERELRCLSRQCSIAMHEAIKESCMKDYDLRG